MTQHTPPPRPLSDHEIRQFMDHAHKIRDLTSYRRWLNVLTARHYLIGRRDT